ITSFYMFRLMYMTFGGDYRGAPVQAHDARGHDSHGHPDDHGHGDPHESPWVMLGPLVILAVLSTVGGFLGYGNWFEHFLAPVFRGATEVAQGAPAEAGKSALEYSLMVVSVSLAALGWLLAYFLYSRRPELPGRIATALGGLYQAVLNKYYVDEIYADVFVKPLIQGSTTILWHGVDQGVIDATVNNTAAAAREVSDTARHMQSGNLRSYAGWVAAGGAVVIAYMVWMGVR
ncbi:MAG: NADH-quinone oxidoreductase subunit L, partial [Terriglobales bacterium]